MSDLFWPRQSTKTSLEDLTHLADHILEVNAPTPTESVSACASPLQTGDNATLHEEISTLTDDKVVKTCVLQDLEVADMNEDTYLSLPEVYTRTSIPVGKDDLPRHLKLKSCSCMRIKQMTDRQYTPQALKRSFYWRVISLFLFQFPQAQQS